MKIPFIHYIPEALKKQAIAQSTDDDLRLAYTERLYARNTTGKVLSGGIEPDNKFFQPKSIKDWKNALASATDFQNPNLALLSDLYDNLLLDSHVRSVMETRVLRLARSPFNLVNQNGEIQEEAKALLLRPWFDTCLRQRLWKEFTGVKVLELFETDETGELIKATVLPMAHILPHRQEIAKHAGDDSGVPYNKGGIAKYYIQIGETRELGLLSDLAPLIIAKKLAMGSWLDYVEKYSIDPRVIYTNNFSPERESKLFDMAIQMLRNHVAVLKEGERIEALESSDKDAYQIFKELLQFINDELSKAVLGQAGTVDAKEKTGTYGSMQVMQGLTEQRYESDKLNVQSWVNKTLLPRLPQISTFYNSLNGLQMEWDDSENITNSELTNRVVQLTQAGYDLDIEYLTETLGIPILGKNQPNIPTPPEGEKKK
jgi:hypothetical protein